MVDPGDVVLLKKGCREGQYLVCASYVECGSTNSILIPGVKYATDFQRRFAPTIRRSGTGVKTAQFATLMRIAEVHPLPPIEVPKRDRRGWVILRAHRQATAKFR